MINQSKEENFISRTIGQRLRESRELSNYMQNQAAFLLGIDPKELASYENAVDLDGSIPNWLILKASAIYDVSIDYLYGASEDWELDPIIRNERDLLSIVNKIHIQDHAEQLAKILAIENKISVSTDAVKELEPAIKGIDEAMSRFRELNPKFDDMPAGSTLLKRIADVQELIQEVRCQLIRFKVIPIGNKADVENHEI